MAPLRLLRATKNICHTHPQGLVGLQAAQLVLGVLVMRVHHNSTAPTPYGVHGCTETPPPWQRVSAWPPLAWSKVALKCKWHSKRVSACPPLAWSKVALKCKWHSKRVSAWPPLAWSKVALKCKWHSKRARAAQHSTPLMAWTQGNSATKKLLHTLVLACGVR